MDKDPYIPHLVKPRPSQIQDQEGQYTLPPKRYRQRDKIPWASIFSMLWIFLLAIIILASQEKIVSLYSNIIELKYEVSQLENEKEYLNTQIIIEENQEKAEQRIYGNPEVIFKDTSTIYIDLSNPDDFILYKNNYTFLDYLKEIFDFY